MPQREIGQRGFGKIDAAILVTLMAVLCVVALPRYNRFVKTAEARSTIQQMEQASRAALRECSERTGDPAARPLPSDEELIRALKKHLGGAVPENPFTRNTAITLKHHRAIGPCDALDAQGGWVWNLVPAAGDGRAVESRIWLNSDTVNIAHGRGESCIQP